MKFTLQRNQPSDLSTIGALYADGVFVCHTLEDVVREVEGKPVAEWKIPGKTAIPAGTYRVQPTFSNRFQRILPQLLDVPGFTGIRIHPGNSPKDTEGCILPGRWMGGDKVIDSRDAFSRIVLHIDAALKRGEKVWIEIRNANAKISDAA